MFRKNALALSLLVAAIMVLSPLMIASAQNVTPTAPAQDAKPLTLTYSNGSLVTHPGAGAGGADESRLQTASLSMTTLGFGHQVLNGNTLADDFTVTGGPWTINSITFYAYQTGSTTTSTITGVYYQIWDGSPDLVTSALVAGTGDISTNRLTSTTFSNIYRVTETTIGATDRPIMASTASAGFTLDPGTYWIEWQSDGSLGSGPWAPPVTIVGQTTTGNALQNLAGTWGLANDGGTLTQQDFPFDIDYDLAGVTAALYCDGNDLVIELLAGVAPFDVDYDGGSMLADVALGTHVIAGPGAWTNIVITDGTGSYNYGDMTCPATVSYPNKGEIMISAGAPVEAYAAAGNYPTGIILPADYDGNGFDTYIITGSTTVGGETWYSIFMGGTTYVWVPASQVTILR